ncbi:MAG: helix-turn-helix domain-containing protein [Alphaproteobacteria bacterium]
MSSHLAIKIKELIDSKNLSVLALEKKSGLKVGAIRNILTGHSKKPSAENLLAICRVLECSISELLNENILGAPAKEEFREYLFENMKLLNETANFLTLYYKEEGISLTNKEFLTKVEKIYKYSFENNQGLFDQKFAHWLLSQDVD